MELRQILSSRFANQPSLELFTRWAVSEWGNLLHGRDSIWDGTGGNTDFDSMELINKYVYFLDSPLLLEFVNSHDQTECLYDIILSEEEAENLAKKQTSISTMEGKKVNSKFWNQMLKQQV